MLFFLCLAASDIFNFVSSEKCLPLFQAFCPLCASDIFLLVSSDRCFLASEIFLLVSSEVCFPLCASDIFLLVSSDLYFPAVVKPGCINGSFLFKHSLSLITLWIAYPSISSSVSEY